MRRRIARALYATTAAGIALTLSALGLAGGSVPAAAAPRALSPPAYDTAHAGYAATGRWFRFVAATVTVLPVGGPTGYGNMEVVLQHDVPVGSVGAIILIRPGGGSGSVEWGSLQKVTPFGLSPNAGDQIRASISYDGRGHTYFTAADLTQGVTRTVRVWTGNPIYNKASLVDNVASNGFPPATDIRLWQVTGARLTTYTGVRGTVTGPWQTSPVIETTSGTATGTVLTSPAALGNGGADFSIWLRPLPLAYTQSFAGYVNSVGPFRFVDTSLTVPAAQVPAANGGTALVTLGHNGGPTPRPYADINLRPGGGAGSISYDSNAAAGTFTVNPKPDDQLRVSIFYDQHGHYSLTVTDSTQGAAQTVTVPAPYADSLALNSAAVLVSIDNGAVTPPPADIRLWNFTGTVMTTYSGGHGTMFGPWASAEWIDTTDGTAAGTVVADPIMVGTGGAFSVWLRQR
jgi:hypothetical protein